MPKAKQKSFTKEERQKVHQKYLGHCAYCGCDLPYDKMQIDHLESVFLQRFKPKDQKSDINAFDNLMPSCKSCNYYKGASRLETFRKKLKTLSRRLLTKNSAKFVLNLAVRYGIVEINEFDGEFYFEKYEKLKDVPRLRRIKKRYNLVSEITDNRKNEC